MPFQPFTPPPTPEYPDWWVVTPQPQALPPPVQVQPVTQVSGIPVTPRRKRRWWLLLVWAIAFLLFEPVRILGITLLFFWILAIGVMPHVAILKVATGSHRR